jgi:hypothetical protein
LSVDSGDDNRPNPEDEIPRQGLLAAMPKRTLYRVVLLLAGLGGIIYLRQRTASIANCMSDAFRLPPPAERSGPIKARVVLPPDPLEESR